MTKNSAHYDVLIIGAGAAGLMCAIEAGRRGQRVGILDHAEKAAEKIRISGGGRCNFTNLHCGPGNFLSQNPAFCRSALSRYTQQDFIAMVERHGIAWHEKTLGQLFCDGRSQAIIDMLLTELRDAQVDLRTGVMIEKVEAGYTVHTRDTIFTAASLVIATGGPSIPKMGATGFGYDIARQFGIAVVAPRPALVPLTFTDPDLLGLAKSLAGVAVDPSKAACDETSFREALLFTHRGLSGPAILQISSYWQEGQEITLNLLPDEDALTLLKRARTTQPRQGVHTILSAWLPVRLAEAIVARAGSAGAKMADLSDARLLTIADHVQAWRIKPNGTEGFRTAEVTLGGVDTAALSSRTFEATKVKGLYFIGEVIDVTGHLGGHNFQWAWSSGWCAGQFV